ncbi:transmembrane domain-containing protein [Cryptosporidium canis]|uniref:Acyltransferase n=1 Tax=Cryptosporidium canis TaxID=195482 RepID=A0A9D5HWN3_9CRYT|nr:transmembrane domain-containing protein [Cryptosporidium canis]
MSGVCGDVQMGELGNGVRVVDIPVNYSERGIRPILGCISYTILLFTWGVSILIPVALAYWLFHGNWNMVLFLSTIILVPIMFNWHDNVPGLVKHFSNLLTGDIHHWTEDPDFESNSKQLLCLHPHGIFGIGSMYIIISGIFPRLHLVVTESLVWLQPIISLILNSAVKLRGASHLSFRKAMQRQEGPLMIFPGGFHETVLLDWGKDSVYIEKRFGFIKYCLKYSYSIRPVYVFGECLSFHQLQHFKRLRWLLNDFSLPSVVFCGETWWNPLLPVRNVPYLIVIGKPIRLDSTEMSQKDSASNGDPSRELVRKYHSLYIQNLQRIFNKYSPFYKSIFSGNPILERYLKTKYNQLQIE